MKLSFDWLSEYVDLSGLTAYEVAEKLTMGAFEVEEVAVVGPDLEGPIVVGEILEIHQHPNADKIRLTKTRVAPGAEPLEIVCGAANIVVGQRIPVALAGAKVINRHDGTALIIKKSAIRGVTSNGMLCSAPELGITNGAGADGILILGEGGRGPELGTDIRQVLPVKPDYILHVEPRSNRGDALSVLGLAREVAALFGRSLRRPDWSIEATSTSASTSMDADPFQAAWVENTSDCPFLTLRVINNIKVGPSHPDIVARLEAMGMRSVNNVVDITNYVMHELGQPLHAYDASLLKHGQLGARRALAGEKITTLDGKERVLSEEVLVIADQKQDGTESQLVGIAGIMGGKDSEISESSTALVLEAACFTSAVVRRGSRLLGLSSDASLRFERGVDVASVLNASNRAAYLIHKYCGASTGNEPILGPLLTAGSDAVAASTVALRSSAIMRLLGIAVSDEKVRDLLTPLGFGVSGSGENISVSVPSFRQEDVKREVDLIEEVCRLNGYDKIESTMPAATMAVSVPDDTLSVVRSALTGQGLSEAWLSSLVPQSQEVDGELAVRVLNPLSKDHELMRQSLVPGLVGACAYNQDRGRKDVWLFENGRVYFKEAKSEADSKNGKKESDKKGTASVVPVKEDNHLAALVCGSRQNVEIDFHHVKGLVENLLEALNIDERKLAWKPAGPDSEWLHPWLHPYRSAALTLNRPEKPTAGQAKPKSIFASNITLGYLGEVHPRYGDQHGLRDRAYVFELDLSRLQNERKTRKFAEIASTPEVVRDITADFNLDSKVLYDQFARLIWKTGGNNLKAVELVSIYQAPGDAKKSFTCRLTFQHQTETLTNDEIEKVMAAIRENLSRELSASFRL
jgi:phenylalanyl-tRNA synthetase beta chain